MNYTFLKDLIGSPWQIETETLNKLFPVFKGMFSGLQIEKENEPENHLPYAINALDKSVIKMWSQPEEDLEDDPEQEHEEEPKVKVINVIPIRSVLTKHDQMCGPVGTRTLASRLMKADGDDNVIGHILVIESGGGQAMAVAEMTEAMDKCTKPIVAWIDGMAASAAYYIACYAREIIASREMDYVGCIGTMTVFSGRKSKSEANSLGDVEVTIYADGSEEKNEEYEKAINEFDFKLQKDRILNPFNEKFHADVKGNRPQVLDDQLKGRTYYAKDVVGSLVDSIGGFETAVDSILALANFKNDPGTGSNNQSIKPKKEMKQFTHLNQALNVEALEGTDEGVFLQEEQLQSIESRLEAEQQLVSERDTAVQERETANASLVTAQESITAAQATVAAAYDPFNAIDPTIAAAETPEAKAEAVRTLLSTRPGVAPVGNLGKQDEVISDGVDWEAIDNLEHNKQVDLNN